MRKIFDYIFPAVAVVLGIVVIVMGAGKYAGKNKYDASVTGVITGIEREWNGTDSDGFDEYTYNVYVDYEVNGKKYENARYPSYDSSMKKGDKIEILYQTSDPSSIAEADIAGNAVILIVIGAVVTAAGIVVGVRTVSAGRKQSIME